VGVAAVARCALVGIVLVAVSGGATGDEGGAGATDPAREQKTRQLVAEGLSRFNVGEYDEAAKRFAEAYVLQPLPELLYDLAQIAAKQGRHEKAIELYGRYQSTLPSSSAQARAIEDKIEGLHQAVAQETAPQQAARRLRSGRALLAHGRLDDAEEELDGGYALDPLPTFLVALGDVAKARNDKATAMAHYGDFLAKAPADDPERPYARAQLDGLQPPAVAPPPVERKRSRKLWWLAAPAAVVAAGIIVAIYFGATADSSSVPQIPVSLHK
jgi:tetratricopeptide (TPR) repeat protein